MKIITICGSLKFADEMQRQAERLELEGNCVLNIIYPTRALKSYRAAEISALNRAHLRKIELSDTVFVVNKNGYIGEAVRKELTYAKGLDKEIIYWEQNE